MIYNLSTILNETMKKAKEKAKEKSNTIQIPNSFLQNNKINPHNLRIDIELANKKSLDLYNKLNSKPKFSILDLNQIINKNKNKNEDESESENESENENKSENKKDNQIIDKKQVNKNGLVIVGCFCLFLASFHYFNFNLKKIKGLFSFRLV